MDFREPRQFAQRVAGINTDCQIASRCIIGASETADQIGEQGSWQVINTVKALIFQRRQSGTFARTRTATNDDKSDSVGHPLKPALRDY